MNTHSFVALPIAVRCLAVLIILAALLCGHASAQVLVGDVFVNGFEGWTDTFDHGTQQAGDPPSWGTLLTDSLTGGLHLVEDSDGRGGDGATNAGDYTPFLLINSADVTPATYDLSATLATFDNDGLGVAFGYQDNDNYFRVGVREQSSGNLGFSVGTAVQKVVGGVITQLDWDSTATPPTDGTPFAVDISVDGANWMVSMNGTPISSGTDADLQPGNYGVLSWAQGGSGTIVQEVSVASASLNKTHTFAGAVSSVPWRTLTMTNADAVSFGNPGGTFHQAFANGTIEEGSNGFTNATETAANVDFMGPAIVVDSPGNETWSDYRMTVRMNTLDDDGIGLLFRVADDDSFYRINFEQQTNTTTRPPLGMSVQKNDNGAWSELYRDDQANPLFVHTQGTPFDVTVRAIGDTFAVQVSSPDGVVNYPLITDGSNPILAGTVGFAVWGNDSSFYGPFGGDGQVLLVAIPEPSTFCLLALWSVFALAVRRRG